MRPKPTQLYCFSFALFFALFASDCDDRIVMRDLYEATPNNVPIIRQLDSFAYDDKGGINNGYELTNWDLVQLDWKDAARAGHPIQVRSYVCSGGNCNTCPNSGVAANTVLIEGLHPRLPLSVLGRINGIEIYDTSGAPQVVAPPINLCESGQQFTLDPLKGIRWPAILQAFSGSNLKLSLISSPARRVIPADPLRITVEWQFLSGDTADTFSVAQFHSEVDRFGRARVPGLSSPGLKELAPAALRPSGLAREWVSNLDRAAFEIQFWQPGKEYWKQVTLQQVSSCLSAIWSHLDLVGPPPQSISEEIKECLTIGAEGLYYQDARTLGKNNHRVRYQIDTDQTWKIHLEDGRTFQRTYVPGETIGRAVTSVLRENLGKELRSHKPKGDEIYVVVIPRRELGGASAPFWGVINSRHHRELNSIFIAPGDSIILSGRKPKPWKPDDDDIQQEGQ